MKEIGKMGRDERRQRQWQYLGKTLDSPVHDPLTGPVGPISDGATTLRQAISAINLKLGGIAGALALARQKPGIAQIAKLLM